MLVEEIRQRMVAAVRSGQALEKGILKLALGEVQTAEARSGKALGDEQVASILRKLMKSNRESLAASTEAARRTTLAREIEVLEALLPKTLSAAEIAAALEPVKEEILAAGNDGQATGIAIKHLKAAGSAVQGKDVAQAVRAMRA